MRLSYASLSAQACIHTRLIPRP